ncbi:MAG: GNAT family N-acetyltransferase [bacterium]|nr:GNAT family N-acetyltransferase [bacterium]
MTEQSISKFNLMKLISIVPCTPEDFSDLRALHKMAINATGWHFYSLAEVAAQLIEIDQPDYTIALLSQNVLLAKLDNLLVGAASWRPSNAHLQTAIVTTLYLHPAYTNGGCATALIQKCEQASYDRGFRWISALSDLNSRLFFFKLGYEAKGYRNSKRNRSVQYPLQVMTRHISTQYGQTKKAKSTKLSKHSAINER